jgi:hypothetical protein
MKFKLLTIGATLAIVAAACSSAGSEPDQGVASLETGDMAPVTTVADQTDSTQSEEEVALAFAQCLRDEGIDVDDPTVDSSGNVRPPRTRDILNATDGLTLDEINSARDACMPLLDGVTFGFESIDPTEREDQLLEFAACMRENGYDLPDPDLTKTRGSGGGPFGGSIDLTDPAFQAAAAACDGLFGGFSGQPGTGSNG